MRALTTILLLLLAAGTASAATMQALEAPPVERKPVTLTFTDEGAPVSGLQVSAVYRENAHDTLRREQVVGTTDAAGNVQWTPEAAGVVVVTWEGGTQNVSVLYDGKQPGAILIAVLAGLMLLGGSAMFFAQMLTERRPDQPPST